MITVKAEVIGEETTFDLDSSFIPRKNDVLIIQEKRYKTQEVIMEYAHNNYLLSITLLLDKI